MTQPREAATCFGVLGLLVCAGRVFMVDYVGGIDHRFVKPRCRPARTTRKKPCGNCFRRTSGFASSCATSCERDSTRFRFATTRRSRYKSGLAAELSRNDLQTWLRDDSPWIRLMAASGLWDAAGSAEARDVLATLAESEPTDSWPAKMARGKLKALQDA